MRRVYQRDEQGRRYWELDEEFKQIFMGKPSWGTLTISVDMTDAELFRKELRRESETHITITSLIIKAAVNAVEDFPLIAGVWLSLDKIWPPNPGEVTVWILIQIGDLAGSLIIEKVGQKGLLEISNELHAKVNEVSSNPSLSEPPPEVPHLRITNIGTIGPVEIGTLEVNEPHRIGGSVAGLLGIGTILEKPAVKDGEIQVRKMMNVVLFWDHSAMMANTPIEFLSELKTRLEGPETYLV